MLECFSPRPTRVSPRVALSYFRIGNGRDEGEEPNRGHAETVYDVVEPRGVADEGEDLAVTLDLAESALVTAARATGDLSAIYPRAAADGDEKALVSAAPPKRLERSAFGLGRLSTIESSRGVSPDRGVLVDRDGAVEVLTLAAARDPRALPRAVEVLSTALEAEQIEQRRDTA